MRPTPFDLGSPFRATSNPTDRVIVWRGQSRNGAWHVDPACLLAPTTSLVSCEDSAQFTYANLDRPAWGRHQPCRKCAVPVLVQFAFHAATIAPRDSRQVVLSCPRPTKRAGHHPCPDCRFLRQVAERHDLTRHTTTDGYTLIAGNILWDVLPAVERGYPTHLVPHTMGPLTADVLEVAWTLRKNRRIGDTCEQHAEQAMFESRMSWQPTARLALIEASLIMAPAA